MRRSRVEQVPFEHPLWVVYSSGTTGLPKPIVHSQGGIVVEHVKMTALHFDLGPEDRFHWYSSSGWVMWNCQVAGLLMGSTICIYDGNPGWPDWNALWRFVGETRVTFFGAGAAFFLSCLKAHVEPNDVADLSALRAIGSTGSPLPPEGYQWIYDHVRSDIWLNPVSGGTDFAGCFVGGVPTLPVYLGEMQCRCLGAKVEAWDEAGRPLVDEVGELVCSAPMPSMPLMFWNDPWRRALPRKLFRHVSRRLAPRRLDSHHAARRRDHLRPLGCHHQPPRHPHGYQRVVPRGGGNT
jgi:acetoacetyl-CoA synthetase